MKTTEQKQAFRSCPLYTVRKTVEIALDTFVTEIKGILLDLST